jgi:hypothetical protein
MMLNQKILALDMPDRLKRLRVSSDGFPIPWFVAYVDGKPDFRAMDGEKMGIAIRHRRCWMCGEPLGVHLVFAIGPMCMVNRSIAEPPSHRDCLKFAVQACPFLSQPRMRRNEKDKPEGSIAGVGLKRNPGVTVLWTTRSYRLFRAPNNGGTMFEIGEPERVEFVAEGRTAKRQEILESMESGLPSLAEIARTEIGGMEELERRYAEAMKYLPDEVTESIQEEQVE